MMLPVKIRWISLSNDRLKLFGRNAKAYAKFIQRCCYREIWRDHFLLFLEEVWQCNGNKWFLKGGCDSHPEPLLAATSYF